MTLRIFVAALVACLATADRAAAVSYASGVRNTGGSSYEFVLNAPSMGVTINRTGDTPLNLGALPAGRHSFSASGAFEINVASSFARFQRLSDPSNLFTRFGRSNGIAVNRDPASPYFGTVYVSQGNAVSTFAQSSPVIPARSLTDGIYALSANMVGMNASTFAPVADPQSTAFVGRPASWLDGSALSPYRITLDASGNVIVADWGDAAGGVKYVTRDLSSGGLILGGQGGPSPTGSVGGGFSSSNHGSTTSQVTVTGSVGNNLTIWAIDEDLAVASNGVGGAPGVVSTDGNNLWKWNVGAATGYTAPAELVVDANSIPLTTDGRRNFLSLNIGILADAVRSPLNPNQWYLTQNRSSGNESGLAIVTAGVGGVPTLNFSSRQWTIDNGYDGYPGEFDSITSDILRNIGSVDISADGRKLYLHRVLVEPNTSIGAPPVNQTNPLLGAQSNLPGAVIVIPLDANGIPVITVNDNGTPFDRSDDRISNWESITITGNDLAHVRAEVELDAVGNVYTGNNAAQLVEVYSAGGLKVATTRSNGTFSVIEVPEPSGFAMAAFAMLVAGSPRTKPDRR